MRWEPLALALITQVLQAGIKTVPHSFARPEPAEVEIGAECHCSCICVGKDTGVVACGFSGVIGALGASVICWCKGTAPTPSSPHPRRRGHGVISEPSTWADPRSLLQ